MATNICSEKPVSNFPNSQMRKFSKLRRLVELKKGHLVFVKAKENSKHVFVSPAFKQILSLHGSIDWPESISLIYPRLPHYGSPSCGSAAQPNETTARRTFRLLELGAEVHSNIRAVWCEANRSIQGTIIPLLLQSNVRRFVDWFVAFESDLFWPKRTNRRPPFLVS